jgi:hypothetical protein
MMNFLIGPRKKIHFERKAGGKVERPIQGSLSISEAGEIPYRLESEWLRE